MPGYKVGVFIRCLGVRISALTRPTKQPCKEIKGWLPLFLIGTAPGKFRECCFWVGSRWQVHPMDALPKEARQSRGKALEHRPVHRDLPWCQPQRQAFPLKLTERLTFFFIGSITNRPSLGWILTKPHLKPYKQAGLGIPLQRGVLWGFMASKS